MHGFLSHSHENANLAARLADDLEQQGFQIWIDKDNLRAGGLLLEPLQQALEASRSCILLWSEPASRSRFVKAEWTAAWHLEKAIVPCTLDDTELAPFLLDYLRCDLRPGYEAALACIAGALGGAPLQAGHPPSPPSAAAQQLARAIFAGQQRVLAALQRADLDAARAAQEALVPKVAKAARHRDNALLLNLAGYDAKNACMIEHWDAIQARQPIPADDPRLQRAEELFFDALAVQPDDMSSLNGLGSILTLRGDLDAAEFFVRRALDRAAAQGRHYEAAEQDLATIQKLKAERG